MAHLPQHIPQKQIYIIVVISKFGSLFQQAAHIIKALEIGVQSITQLSHGDLFVIENDLFDGGQTISDVC